jgi:hypothetical protein
MTQRDIVERIENRRDDVPVAIVVMLDAAVAEIERLRAALTGPFICGTVGNPDSGGLHDGYIICPAYGSDYIAVFKRIANEQIASPENE